MKKFILPALSVISLGAIIVSLTSGRFELSLGDIFSVISGSCGDAMKESVFLRIRLPRTMMAFIAGAALSLAGWVYQNIFMNTLVSPDVLGVSGGCSIGAIAGILLGLPAAYIQGFSLAAGLITVGITLLLARAIGRFGNVAMLMSGIVVSALANSAIMLMKYTADPNRQLAAIEYWLMGSFHAASKDMLISMLPVVLTGIFVALIMSQPVRMLAFGDEEAAAMGVNVPVVKYVALTAATAMVAGVISVAGSVSWLGLIVPHVCRIAGGERHTTAVEVCLMGGALLTFADTAARTLTSSEIPISILTSFMGALFLLALLAGRAVRSGRSA